MQGCRPPLRVCVQYLTACRCEFSNTVVQILNACETPFETFDVLENPDLREGIKRYSNWPTIPRRSTWRAGSSAGAT